MAKEEGIDPQEVDQIRVGLNQGSYNVVCDPLEKKRNPASFKEALFSLPYGVASALVRGHVSLEDFTPEAIQDKGVRSMANRVIPFVDKEIEKQHGRTLGPAVVEITIKNGKTSSRRVAFVKGHPNNPMTMEECEEKFRRCVPYSAKGLKPEKVSGLLESLRSLERLNDVSTIADFLK
jgi:2-methylcitrate dehydratase PrpD